MQKTQVAYAKDHAIDERNAENIFPYVDSFGTPKRIQCSNNTNIFASSTKSTYNSHSEVVRRVPKTNINFEV